MEVMQNFKKRTVSNGASICWNNMNLPRMEYGYCVFTINKEEVINDGGVIVVDSSRRENQTIYLKININPLVF